VNTVTADALFRNLRVVGTRVHPDRGKGCEPNEMTLQQMHGRKRDAQRPPPTATPAEATDCKITAKSENAL